MKVLHIVRKREDLTTLVDGFLGLIGDGHEQQVVCLDVEKDEADFGRRLLELLAVSDRVICW